MHFASVAFIMPSEVIEIDVDKNFTNGVNARITGEQLLQAAVNTIKELQYMAGGMVIFQ